MSSFRNWASNAVKRVARIGFSTAQAASMTAGVVGSLGKSMGGMIAGVGMGLIQGVNAYCFQGKEIVADADNEKQPEAAADGYVELEAGVPAGCGNAKSSYLAQLLYTGFDAAKSGSNRYFILATILKPLTSSNPFFWGYFGISMLIKQIFNMTNETYATTKEIAEICQGENADSCFKSLFCCTGPNSIAAIRTLGSLDHTINDDLLPLIALIPSSLLINPIFLGISSPFLLLLIYAIYKQTDLFEGTKCEENLRGVKNLEPSEMSDKLKTVIRLVIKYLMAPLHGAADGVPVYLILREKNLALSIITAVLTTLGSSVGIFKSEVKKALEQLDKTPAPVSTASRLAMA